MSGNAPRKISLPREGLWCLAAFAWLAGCGAPPESGEEARLAAVGGLSESEFDLAIETAYGAFHDAVAGSGSWDLRRDWGSAQESAWSARSGSVSRTYVTGGFARRPEFTPDGFLLTLCHEVGHFLAGAPVNAQGLSAEGQADWYATGSCLPALWRDAANTAAPASDVDPALSQAEQDACGATGQSSALCVRVMRAAWSAMHMAAARRALPAPEFATPDPTVAAATVTSGYPGLQCRLDTMRAGALGLPRPACWFRSDP